MADDVVYVIGGIGSSTVKIGVSNQVSRRLREIQFMSPVRLEVLWSIPGSYDLERALHDHFSSIRSHGEWFNFGQKDPVATVQEALAVVLGSDGVTVMPPFQPSPDGATPEAEKARHRARLLPLMSAGSVFTRDPKNISVSDWPKLRTDVPYYLESDQFNSADGLRCWCGHQIGSHDSVRPHACGGSVQYGPVLSDCMCLGYEGPLSGSLVDYDLPGQNWQNWKIA